MQNIIKKPYKIDIKNAKKKNSTFNFCYIFKAIFEKVVFYNFETSKDF